MTPDSEDKNIAANSLHQIQRKLLLKHADFVLSKEKAWAN